MLIAIQVRIPPISKTLQAELGNLGFHEIPDVSFESITQYGDSPESKARYSPALNTVFAFTCTVSTIPIIAASIGSSFVPGVNRALEP